MKVTIHTDAVEEEVSLEYVVIAVRQDNQWVLARHKERSTWEFAGGHIDSGEAADAAAARELYEETGAEEFSIIPVCIYSVAIEGVPESYGKFYLADVIRFGQIPQYEMAEIRGFTDLPEDLTYPLIVPVLLAEAKAFMLQGGRS
ncbi:NUDIX hydrolase [Paenibacillus sp. FSL R7-0331]|uniref:NUDIX hydrolase n=1 Tax=Paenibacillus sp. FSL R7-0331 TaxID=1536773 RepID=UPI0005A64B43|nr:NUDIX domain-containing protein [Paenibacillus sp. FSL R7-0331]